MIILDLHVSGDGIFVHTMIGENEGCDSMRNGGRAWSAPAASAVGGGLSFQCKKREKGEKGNACRKCRTIFSRYLRSKKNDQVTKRNIPQLLQTQEALVCLLSISEMLQCQQHFYVINCERVCWILTVL